MFYFFKELIEKKGIRLIEDFNEKLNCFIKESSKEDGTQIGSSGYGARIGSSGYGAQIGSSRDYARIGSSGDYAQIGSSGYGARIGSSGDEAQIGSSGDYARIGSSGDYARIGSSGYGARIGSSGYGAQIGSSGDYAQIGSSGYRARIGSSGYEAQIGSSGYEAQIGSSGYGARIGSSGYGAQIDIAGENSICFACGFKGYIKAKKGTWIALAEYSINEEGSMIPIFSKTAQIGNKEYKDFRGKTLNSKNYYILWQKEFYPVECVDEIWTVRISEKKRDNITIIKAIDIDDIYIKKPEDIEEIYIVKEGKLSAHGTTLREAIEDLNYKRLEDVDTEQIVKEIRETGKVTRSQYRAITGACSFGTNKFCVEHNIQDLEEIEIEELRKILINDYGAEKFWKLIDGE